MLLLLKRPVKGLITEWIEKVKKKAKHPEELDFFLQLQLTTNMKNVHFTATFKRMIVIRNCLTEY